MKQLEMENSKMLDLIGWFFVRASLLERVTREES